MSVNEEHSVTAIFMRMREGDEHAAQEIFERFFPRLQRIAAKILTKRNHVVTDADDAVQSAFFSFWQKSTGGDFKDDMGRADVWRLLAHITKIKALKHLEREGASKRGGGNVTHASALQTPDGNGTTLDALVANISPVEFDLICEESLQDLDDDIRTVVLLRLMGHKNAEIAKTLGCTIRRVERKFDVAREIWGASEDL